MGGWCKERYNKDENNKLEELHPKPDQMEENRWESQTFSEIVASQEEEEESGKDFIFTLYCNHTTYTLHWYKLFEKYCCLLQIYLAHVSPYEIFKTPSWNNKTR